LGERLCVVERPRCARCRNPIRGLSFIELPGDEPEAYHEDCWRASSLEIQDRYRDQIREQGVLALMSAYVLHRPERPVAADLEAVADLEPVG
jgi:hypothetical protein